MTKKEPQEKRLNDILDAAVVEFVEKGYENTSMDSIAVRAGLTKGGVYYHFDSKDDILIKANERFMIPIMGFMDEAQRNKSAARGLALYIKNYLTYWTSHPQELAFIFLTMTKTLFNPRLWASYQGYTTGMIDFFEGLYNRGIDTGEFRPFDAGSAAVALMAALDGISGYLVIDQKLQTKKTIADLTSFFIQSFQEASHDR